MENKAQSLLNGRQLENTVMKENRTKDFFVVLIVTVLLSVALGYILNRFIYFSNSVWTYVIVWAILFFGYFRIYTILINPKRLLLLPYAFVGTFSRFFFIYPLVWAIAVLIFVFFGPVEYFYKDFFAWATKWEDLKLIFYGDCS